MAVSDDQQPAVGEAHLEDVPLEVRFDLGSVRIPLRELRALGAGQVFRLASGLDEVVEIRFSGELLGRGELVLVDGTLAVRVTRVVAQ
jgi:flagellar motor switch/type III secretory pathway protein FliN